MSRSNNLIEITVMCIELEIDMMHSFIKIKKNQIILNEHNQQTKFLVLCQAITLNFDLERGRLTSFIG